MLILSRQSGDSIRIGEDVIVTVREVHASYVRLHVQAPRPTKILRGELYESPKEEPERMEGNA